MAKRSSKSASKPAAPQGRAPSGPGPRIAVFHGPDAFLQAEHTRHVREALEATLGAEGVQTVAFDGDGADIADVLDECRSFDLMQRHKLVTVESADKLVSGDNRAIMERYAQSPSPGASLILRCSKWNKGKALDALIDSLGGFTACEQPGPAEAAAWAVKRAEKRHNTSLSRECARAIVDRVGADLGRIDMEVAKLGAAAGVGAPITLELIAELTGRSGEEELWAVQGPLLGEDPEAAIGAVRDALTLWRQSATGVVYAEIDLIRKAHAVARLVEQGADPFGAAKRARIWRDGDRVAALGRRAGAGALRTLLDESLANDVRAKSGRGDAQRAAETIGVRIAMLGRGERR